MHEVVAPQVYQILRPVMAALYLLWAFSWAAVAFHYGRAAYASWRQSGGRWRTAFADVLQPFWWGLREAACRWRLLRGSAFCGAEIPTVYARGNMLRFAIFLGSLTPVVFGFYFENLDRHAWRVQDFAVTMCAVLVSTLAAGGHLFLAYKTQPRQWSNIVALGAAWVLLGPVLMYFAQKF